jgi:F-type H+-transporting ATPase subunit b
MSALLKDPMFFYGIAFVIFLGLAYRYGRKPILDWIDGEILKIRDELEQAKKLRIEAEITLADYKKKQVAAMADAEAIVRHAKDEAARLKTQAEADLKAALARHEQQALERIRIAEAEAMADVRTAAINAAMAMANKMLASHMDEATAAKLTDQAIGEVSKSAAAKAKAA